MQNLLEFLHIALLLLGHMGYDNVTSNLYEG